MDTNESKEEVLEELNDLEEIQPANETPIKDDITPDKKIDDVINLSNSDNNVSSENNDNVDLNEPVVLKPSNANINEEQTESSNENQSVVLENNNSEEKTTKVGEKTESEAVEQSMDETKKKSKMPLIILLSILLVIDIAALVIYIIGIDKVLGFIK